MGERTQIYCFLSAPPEEEQTTLMLQQRHPHRRRQQSNRTCVLPATGPGGRMLSPRCTWFYRQRPQRTRSRPGSKRGTVLHNFILIWIYITHTPCLECCTNELILSPKHGRRIEECDRSTAQGQDIWECRPTQTSPELVAAALWSKKEFCDFPADFLSHCMNLHSDQLWGPRIDNTQTAKKCLND